MPVERPPRSVFRTRWCVGCKARHFVRAGLWNAEADLCNSCAEKHQQRQEQRRLTIRVPPLANGRPCNTCGGFFNAVHYENRDEVTGAILESHMKCRRCRRRQTCSACRKSKKLTHFKRPEGCQVQTLFKTCHECRTGASRRAIQRRQFAEQEGVLAYSSY